MEPPDQKQHDEHRVSEPPPEGEQKTRNGGPSAPPPVIETSDPLVRSGPSSPSQRMSDPDRTMVIETNRIREPDAALTPTFVPVPVEFDRPPHAQLGAEDKGENRHQSKGRKSGSDTGAENGKEGKEKQGGKSHEGQEGHSKKKETNSNQDRNDDQGESGDRHMPAHGKSGQPPSLTRILLYSGIVSLVCGIVGAWGYSYFFGSDKSGDQKSSSKGPDSSQGSGSGGGSDSGQGSGSGGGSGSKPKSGPSSNDPETSKLLQAEGAWLTAVKEFQRARAAEDDARHSEEETKAVLDFLKRTLFSAGRPGAASLSEAFWTGGQGKDVMLRSALDGTESQVAEALAERPLAEASVRELLGLAYLNLGDPAQAVKQYERALALRQAMQGASDPDTAACRNQLAVAYRLAGRTAEGDRLFDRNPNSPARATALAINGSMLLGQKKPADAELKLRECLAIREKTQPDDWMTFDTKSMLGEALLDQRKFDGAEPLLVSGYEGLKQRRAAIPARDRPRVAKALERLVRLYEIWGKPEEASKWRREMDASDSMNASPAPTSAPNLPPPAPNAMAVPPASPLRKHPEEVLRYHAPDGRH